MNDAQLVEACLEGDHRAYAVLVDRYRYPVFGLCLSYVKDFDAAEDARGQWPVPELVRQAGRL